MTSEILSSFPDKDDVIKLASHIGLEHVNILISVRSFNLYKRCELGISCSKIPLHRYKLS